MDLILESSLYSARESLGLLSVRHAKVSRDYGTDLVRSTGTAKFADGVNDRPDVPGELRRHLLLVLHAHNQSFAA
jgi:hypothetical protein